MIRGSLPVLTLLLLILCFCSGDAQTRTPSLSATPSDQKPGVKIQHVSFATEDGGLIYADLYGEGDQDVVLAHGGRFTKESWQPQAQQLARAGFHVLAFDFRGFGQSHGPGDSDMFTAPMQLDVLAAVRYLRKSGAKTVAIVGGSFGGGAALDASIASQPGGNQWIGAARGRLEWSCAANQGALASDSCAG